MFTKRRSRSGISSLIGAIFFVLVVFLVFTSTILIFENFTTYATQFKQVNSAELQNRNTVVAVQALSFGGLSSVLADESLAAQPNAAPLRSYLPIQNMNFTNSFNGWTFSRGYELSLHNGTASNYPKNVLPGLDVFTLVISNTDSSKVYSLGTVIVGVTIDVNDAWKVPGSAPLYVPQTAPLGWTVSVLGNEITWTANAPACTNGVYSQAPPPPNNNPTTFSWSAVPPPVTGTYEHDVTLTWETVIGPGPTCGPIKDQGTTTLTSKVVTSTPGGVDTEKVAAEPPGTVPGGSFGGLDSTSTNVGSESGPDSAYLSFQPTFNGQPITTTTQAGVTVPEQLTAEMNFTTYFTLDSAITVPVEAGPGGTCIGGNCPTLSMGYGLDHAISGEPPLIFINVYLNDVTTGMHERIINSTVVNLTNNGWFMNDTQFWLGNVNGGTAANPSLAAGEYSLVVSVTATMFGAQPPSANYPALLLMHFDDIGLAFKETASSYCVDTAATIATGPRPCGEPLANCRPAPAFCGLEVPVGQVSFSGETAFASSTSLTVAGNPWVVNEWMGYSLEYTSGPARGQSAEITANSKNSLTTSPALLPVPNPGGGDSFEIISPTPFTDIQSISFDASLFITAPGTEVTAYAYLENVAASPSGPSWVELGQATFTSTANIDVTIPASSASNYLDEYGTICSVTAESSCIRIYAISSGDFGTLKVNSSMVVQTWQQDESTLTVLNNSTQPVHIVSVYVSGATAIGTSQAFGNATGLGASLQLGASGAGIWIPAGQAVSIQLGGGTAAECVTPATAAPTSLKCFSWVTDQTYVVTVTTDTGLVFTGTFQSP